MTRQITKFQWKSLAIGYFALTGLALHVALTGIWLMRPDITGKAREMVSRQLEKRLPVLSGMGNNIPQVNGEEVQRQIPEWHPLPAQASAPAPQSLNIGTRTFRTAEEALAVLQPGETLDIGPGIYETPMVISIDNVSIRGHGHVVLEKGAAEGKANIVIKGDGVQVSNLECQQISVSDGNGACIRLEGKNLFVDHVYFHDSEQGILTGRDPGFVHLRNSRFERLGSHGGAHGIYIGGGKLLVEDSLFLSGKDQGHEIKTRARISTIVRSVIASLNGEDSRLIDASNGGTLIVEDSLLAQGPNSSNGDAIGFALETPDQTTANDRVLLRNNLIYLERNGTNRLLHLGSEKAKVELLDNLIVSAQETGYESGNLVFETRKTAGLPDYPAFPIERFPQPHPALETKPQPQ